jgi:hypothetical protein
MPGSVKLSPAIALLAAACLAVPSPALAALTGYSGKQTVCTITVNSSNEKEALRRSLSPEKFRFVELVERGRPDWLASACLQKVRCDVLVISGHYDGRGEFYSDQPGVREFLPIDEMERAACSDSCSGLFSQLKEVYLFGCNTLNPEALNKPSSEIGRSLLRAGYSPVDAQRAARTLSARYGGSSRDRMRLIFKGVPVIYGFSAKAPVGPVAASMLDGYLRSGSGEVGSGRASSRLLGHFASTSMTVASGATDAEPLAALRRDVCQFADDGLSAAQKLAFVHQLLDRDSAETRMYLDRIEKYVTGLSDATRSEPATARVLAAIARDQDARARFLAFARDADQASTRARMIEVARRLDWLTPQGERAELIRLIGDRLASNTLNAADVDLACTLNKEHDLDAGLPTLQTSIAPAGAVAQAAILACLGSSTARERVLVALTSPKDEDVQVAQVYLRHRPLTDVNELRVVTTAITRMSDASAQVRALDALADLHVSDPETLEELTRLFPVAETAAVQVAIAGVLLRADYQAIATPDVVQTLRDSRLKAAHGAELIDALIRRLQMR